MLCTYHRMYYICMMEMNLYLFLATYVACGAAASTCLAYPTRPFYHPLFNFSIKTTEKNRYFRNINRENFSSIFSFRFLSFSVLIWAIFNNCYICWVIPAVDRFKVMWECIHNDSEKHLITFSYTLTLMLNFLFRRMKWQKIISIFEGVLRRSY